jgi:hypothetical protein
MTASELPKLTSVLDFGVEHQLLAHCSYSSQSPLQAVVEHLAGLSFISAPANELSVIKNAADAHKPPASANEYQ